MKTVPVTVQGISVKIPAGLLESDLTAREEVKEKVYAGGRGRRWQDVTNYVPIYSRNGDGTITCGLGAILFLARNNLLLDIQFESFKPERKKLSKIVISPGVLDAPKFMVNGRDRYYFFEALDACKRSHCGTVKLPVASGKTVIELVLAENQLREIGTGVIIVPTHAIKEQFEKSAKEFGIELVDYRDWLKLYLDDRNFFPGVLITTPGVLYNDIRTANKTESLQGGVQIYKNALAEIKWVIIDECHHSGCDTWNAIFMILPNLARSHGFSALPIETGIQDDINFNRMSVEDALTISTVGPIIYEKSVADLRHFINVPTLINLTYEWPPKHKGKIYDDWHELRGFILVEDKRTKLIANLINWLSDRGYISITHVLEREYVKRIVDTCDNKKVIGWMGGGYVKNATDKYTTEDLRKLAGEHIFGLVCTSHAIEGVDLDIPIGVTILAEGKKPRQIVQKTGRAARPADKPAFVVNIYDDGISVLPRHAKERMKEIQREFDCNVYGVDSLAELHAVFEMVEK